MSGSSASNDVIALDNLLKNGRTDSIEWIDGQTPPEKIAPTLMAMANSQGGTLFLGITGKDKPRVSGVEKGKHVIDGVLKAAMSLEPKLVLPMPRLTKLKEKAVVIVEIPAGMPHIYSLKGQYLGRKGAKNHALNPRELRQLLLQRGEISFETEIAHGATLDDINWAKAEAYVNSLSGLGDKDVKQVLLRRGCLTLQDGTFYPTNAGILLFGTDPQRFIRNSEITAVRFAGTGMSDTFTRQDIGGTLPDQIRRAETFLVDHLRRGVTLQHTMERSERFEYPLEASRELVVNAVAHRDYSIQGDGIRLFIFKDRMEVTSPGLLPGPVTIENIKDERYSRHPVIVQVLSDMGFIERLGYGVDRVIELMNKEALRPPQFVETAGGFRVVLYGQETHIDNTPASSEKSTPSNEEILSTYNHIILNPRQEKALIHLHTSGNTRITNSELQKMFPDVHAETIRRDLASLVTKDVLNKLGQKRGSFYVLKRDDKK